MGEKGRRKLYHQRPMARGMDREIGRSREAMLEVGQKSREKRRVEGAMGRNIHC